jgi:hypothetical protein
VLATLSRWRSRVQIPSRALAQHGTQTGKAAKLKPSRSSAGSTPARATGREQHASVGHWQASVAVTHSPPAVQVQLLPDALIDGNYGAVRCWSCSEAFNLAHAGSIPVRVTLARCDVGVTARPSTWPTRVQFPSGSLKARSVGVAVARRRGKTEDRVRVPDGLWRQGLFVQRQDTWFAPR